jgi:hypothetical protein
MKCTECDWGAELGMLGCVFCGELAQEVREYSTQLLRQASEKLGLSDPWAAKPELAVALMSMGTDSWVSITIQKYQDTVVQTYEENMTAELLSVAGDPNHVLGAKIVSEACEEYLATGKAKTKEEAISLDIKKIVAGLRPKWIEELSDTVKLIARLHSQRVLAEFGVPWNPEGHSEEAEASS